MSGAMRRIGEYLGLLEDTGRYDDDYADAATTTTYEGRYADETAPVAAERPTARAARGPPGRAVANLADRRRGRAPP